MARGRPVEDETRARVIELCLAGDLGRNEIAKELGIGGATVTAIAQEIGHEFDWSKTALAVAASKVRSDAIRAHLADALLLEAHRALDDLHAPAISFQFESGHEITETAEDGTVTRRWEAGSFREHVLPEPTFSDKRNIMTVVGIAITKAAEVSRPQAGQGAEQGVGILQRLGAKLDRLADGDLLVDVDPTEVPDPSAADKK